MVPKLCCCCLPCAARSRYHRHQIMLWSCGAWSAHPLPCPLLSAMMQRSNLFLMNANSTQQSLWRSLLDLTIAALTEAVPLATSHVSKLSNVNVKTWSRSRYLHMYKDRSKAVRQQFIELMVTCTAFRRSRKLHLPSHSPTCRIFNLCMQYLTMCVEQDCARLAGVTQRVFTSGLFGSIVYSITELQCLL